MVIQMPSKTKISKGNLTVVPSEIRKQFDLAPGDVLVWTPKKDKIELIPRKKITLDDICGTISVGGDAVQTKKEIQSGIK